MGICACSSELRAGMLFQMVVRRQFGAIVVPHARLILPRRARGSAALFLPRDDH